MDRSAKLAAARKKLNQFKRKKGKKAAGDKEVDVSANQEQNISTDEQKYEKDIEIKKSEEFIDEKFELLHCSEEDDAFSESTAATTESILQVSAKLNGIAEEAGMFIDGASSNGSDDYIQVESEAKEGENGPHSDVVKFLESRNQELAAKLSTVLQEKENLQGTLEQKNDEMKQMQMKMERERNIGMSKTSQEEDALREQLKVQMQTIGVLVSEKQDLQQEMMSLRAELQASNTQHVRDRDEVIGLKEKLVSIERELMSKNDSLVLQDRMNSEIKNEQESLKRAFDEMKHALDSEKIQSAELMGRLQAREAEYRDLCLSHDDLQEKLGMADVLLQQMTVNNDSDAVSQVTQLQQDKEALNLKIAEYQQAFEQLSAEREQHSKHYVDTQNQWQSELQNLQLHIQALEGRNQELTNECMILRATEIHPDKSEENSEIKENEDVEKSENVVAYTNEISGLKQELDEAEKTRNLLQEEIASQQSNNQHLSRLVQEKESRIYELENHLDSLNASVKDHEQMLDTARSDKVTISRALQQNKQLKVQLEEIQEGFIKMSNDKMDLATQVSSLEHINKDLESRMQRGQAAYEKAMQDSRLQHEELQRLREHNSYLQSSVNNQTQYSNENDDVIQIFKLKLETAEAAVAKLTQENSELKERLKFVPKEGSSTVFIDMNDVLSLSQDVEARPVKEAIPETCVDETSVTDPVINEVEKKTSAEIISRNEAEPRKDVPMENIEQTSHSVASDLTPMQLLQEKFTSVMKEKADLLNRLELMEHTNTQLQNECDTIGEYIALYHNQRQILKQRHREKDEYISTIVQEREAMQGKVEQLQTLIVALINNRPDGNVSYVTSTPPPSRSSDENAAEASALSETQNLGAVGLENGSPIQTSHLEQPDLVPRTDNSTLDETTDSNSRLTIPGYSKKVRTTSETSSSDNNQETTTAAQILNILEQMQKPVDPGVHSINSIPSGFCMRYIGPYTAI